MANESVFYDLTNNSNDIDKVLQELIGQLNTENKDKIFYIREFVENDNSFLEISTKEINASDVNYTNEAVTANNVQEVIDYILDHERKIYANQKEIPTGNGQEWIQGYTGIYLDSNGVSPDDDNNGRGWKMIGIDKTKSSNTSVVLTDAINVSGSHPKDNYSYLEIGDNSQVNILHNADVKVGRQKTSFVGSEYDPVNTRIHIFDGAKIDIDGGEQKGSEGSPQVFIHGPIQINIDDGTQKSFDTISKNYEGNNSLIPDLKGSAIYMHDKGLLDISKGGSLKASNNAVANFESGNFLIHSSNTSIPKRDPYVILEDGASLILKGIDKGETAEDKCGSCLCLNGNSHIVFNSGDSIGNPDTIDDPYLIGNPNSIVYIGQGSRGAKKIIGTKPTANCSMPDEGNWYVGETAEDKVPIFNPKSLVPSNKNPRLTIGDESIVIIDAADGGGSNYLKIGACDNGQTQTHILDNTHLELRQNSIFSLRGAVQGTLGEIGDYPITRMNELEDKSGSMFTMYDNSTFIMRSNWEEFAAEQYSGRKDFRQRDLTTETWQPNLDFWKQEGSPLFGMVGDSVLKLQGNSELNLNGASIVADGSNFTFKSGEESVSFTINELKQLKALLG